MADRLVQAAIKVTAVGQRKQRLEEFVEKHGEEKGFRDELRCQRHQQGSLPSLPQSQLANI